MTLHYPGGPSVITGPYKRSLQAGDRQSKQSLEGATSQGGGRGEGRGALEAEKGKDAIPLCSLQKEAAPSPLPGLPASSL